MDALLLAESQVVVYAVSLVVGACFPFALPLMGVPRDAVHLGAYVGSSLMALVVTWGFSEVLNRVTRKHLNALTAGLEAIGEVVRESAAGNAPSWESGRLRSLALPYYGIDEVGRAAAAVNALIDALETEHAFRGIVDASGDLVVVLNDATRVTFASESVTTSLGWPTDQFVGGENVPSPAPNNTETEPVMPATARSSRPSPLKSAAVASDA